eukprot:SAG25_NODE_2386_length_1662_cov_1.215611_3_plen_235_part_01
MVWACKRCYKRKDQKESSTTTGQRTTKCECRNLRGNLGSKHVKSTLNSLCQIRSRGRTTPDMSDCMAAMDDVELSRGELEAFLEMLEPPVKSSAGTRIQFLTDRWLCSLPLAYRRRITTNTTHLELCSSLDEDRYEPKRICGSVLVGLGALVHLGEAVTWPALQWLQVAEGEAWRPDRPSRHHRGVQYTTADSARMIRIGRDMAFGKLYSHIWEHQVKRLARLRKQHSPKARVGC